MAGKIQPRPRLDSMARQEIPQSPGVYFFKDGRGKILYIGKAANLRARLSSYLREVRLPSGSRTSLKLDSLLKEAAKLDWEIMNSEVEALIKEAELIKKYRPKYNVLMRDDKNYFYVGFTEEKYPKIFLTHQPRGGADYIGPFTEGGVLRSALKTLHHAFPYCTCKQSHKQPCLNAKLRKCLGYCCLIDQNLAFKNRLALPRNKSDLQNFGLYAKNISAIKKILSGKNRALTKQLKKDMQRLSAAKKYEEAGRARDQIRALERIFEHRDVIKQDMPSESEKALRALSSILGIENINRIEAYDIANIHGKFAYGGIAVWENGSLKKDDYRIFKINSVSGSNDPAMIREVLSRRFNHPEWLFPEVIIIDGGKPQLGAALEVKKIWVKNLLPRSKFSKLKIVALTKNKKHVGDHVFINGQKKPIALDLLPPPLKNLILHLDSEAHRFAIKHYRNLHKKSLLT